MIENIGLVARFVAFVAILLIVGAVVFRIFILKRSGLTTGAIARGSRRSARIGAYASITVIITDIAKLGIQTSEMRFPTDPWLNVGKTLLLETSWGTVWMVRVVLAILLAMMFTLARKDALPRWRTLALFSVGLASTSAFASHAMSAQRLSQFTVPADIAHLLGASLWLGTLGVMFMSIVGADGNELQSELSPQEMRANYIEALLRSFSPLALAGSGLVIASGVLGGLAHIHTFAQLTGTRYGQTLIAKVLCVCVVVLFGWRNWKFVTPLVKKQGPGPMTRSMAAELILTLIVLGITAALVVTPPPAEAMQGMVH